MDQFEIIRLRLEFIKQLVELRRSLIGNLAGIVLLYLLYVALKDSALFVSATAIGRGPSGAGIYIAWTFASGASLDVVRSITKDISLGIIGRFLTVPNGLTKIVGARLLVSVFFGSVLAAVLAGGFFATGVPLPALGRSDVYLLFLYAIQLYPLTLLMCSATIASKSDLVAQIIGLAVCVPFIVIPFEKFIGFWSICLPMAGPLSLIRSQQAAMPEYSLAFIVTILYILGSRKLFTIVLWRLRYAGSILLK